MHSTFDEILKKYCIVRYLRYLAIKPSTYLSVLNLFSICSPLYSRSKSRARAHHDGLNYILDRIDTRKYRYLHRLKLI